MQLAFAENIDNQPLAARMRPQQLSEFCGQQHLLGEGKALQQVIAQAKLHSMILWGPPGTGKTTLAKLMAESIDAYVESISAVLAGVKDIREVVQRAKNRLPQRTILFVDEVHRFNKSQQDAFLPHVEEGTVTLIGATTENPSFELNNALLSRCRVYVLKKLTQEDALNIIQQALTESRGLGDLNINMSAELQSQLATAADGDARTLLNLLEIISQLADQGDGEIKVSIEHLQQALSGQVKHFDNGGEHFHDQISALHKSLRGSDPDAALYWFCSMLNSGCDPLYIARRIVRAASEDIGNADPRALQLALNAWEVQERLGSPEGHLAIGQAILYLASAPKSNAAYTAFNDALAYVQTKPTPEVPLHLRNAPTKLMKQLGYAKHYRYPHNEANAYVANEQYFPDNIPAQNFYQPVERGLELKIKEKLAYLKTLNEAADD